MQHDNCLFCKMAQGLIATEKLYEDERFFVIADINPQAALHLLLITKEHFTNLFDESLSGESASVLSALPQVLADLNKDFDFAGKGMRLLQNNGSAAGQSVMHLHFHLLSDDKLQERLC